MGEYEKIINRYGSRGMDLLLPYLDENYIEKTAEHIISWDKGNVFIATGFYVKGYAETDGPPGTYALGKAILKAGFNPVIITDRFCNGFFEKYGFEVVYADFREADEFYLQLLESYKPTGMISVERCGINKENDYANMRNISIKDHTAGIDRLFELRNARIPTAGIGDGGNEIGMGNVAGVIEEKLDLCPSTVCVDDLVLATVSNWGAYALAHYISKKAAGEKCFDAAEIYDYLTYITSLGAVDGVSGENVNKVDGFEWSVEAEIIAAILAVE